MTRLSRAESQARTRERLISTARPLFARDGFIATSMEKVAAEAGYSKGAVYSNFANKFELGSEVLEQIYSEQLELMLKELDGPATLPNFLQGFGRWAEASIGNEEWTMLELEIVATARSEAAVREQIAARRNRMIDRLTELVDAQLSQLDLVLPISSREATSMALTFGIGIGVQRAIDPSVSVDALVELLGLAGVIAGG